MPKLLYLILLTGGCILAIYGFNESQSVGSEFKRLFTGSPTDRSLWLLIGGVVAVAVGASGLLRGPKRR